MNSYQAKKIPLKDVLSKIGHEPDPRKSKGSQLWYRSPFRSEKTPSFKIDMNQNVWFDHGEGRGGNILDFIMRYSRIHDISSALNELEKIMGSSNQNIQRVVPKNEHNITNEINIDTVQPIKNTALISYLQQRKINVDLAKLYVKEAYYRIKRMPNSRSYFALAFENDLGGYELRNKYFKGCAGQKSTKLLMKKEKGFESAVTVFEGFMDFLSALTHYDTLKPKTDIIILNSIAMQQEAIEIIKSRGYSKVFHYLDHDEAGDKLRKTLEESFKNSVDRVDRSKVYQGFKDFNEFLVAQL